jgi:hypothetical protein
MYRTSPISGPSPDGTVGLKLIHQGTLFAEPLFCQIDKFEEYGEP